MNGAVVGGMIRLLRGSGFGSRMVAVAVAAGDLNEPRHIDMTGWDQQDADEEFSPQESVLTGKQGRRRVLRVCPSDASTADTALGQGE